MAHRIRKIDAIEKVLKVHRRRQRVFLGRARTAWSAHHHHLRTATAARAAAPATVISGACSGDATTDHRTTAAACAATFRVGCRLSTLLIALLAFLRIRCTTIRLTAKTKRAADAQTHSHLIRSLSKVAWNDCLARKRVEIEVSKSRAANVDVVAVSACGRKTWPLVRDAIEVRVAAGNDIKRCSRRRNSKVTKHELPPG